MTTKSASIGDYLQLHLVVLVWGAAGLIGQAIQMPSVSIVFYRMAIAAVALFAFVLLRTRKIFIPSRRDGLMIALGGMTLAFHWWCFFKSIKVSTLSMGLVCLSAAPFFVALLEPLIYRRRLRFGDILVGILCIVGLSLIFRFESEHSLGMAFGLLAAFSDAIYSMLTCTMARKNPSTWVTTYQMLAGSLLLLVIAISVTGGISWLEVTNSSDLSGLLFLGVVSSAFSIAMYVHSLKVIPIFSAVLTINLEPVYGILLAVAIFGEREFMSAGFYLGASVLMTCVLVDALTKNDSFMRRIRKMRNTGHKA